MKDLIIIGAGGFGREIATIVKKEYNFLGFVDDFKEDILSDDKILGKIDFLLSIKKPLSVCIAIADPLIKKNVYKHLKQNKNISFPNIIANDVVIKERTSLGFGNIICENVVITCDTKIGNFVHINVGCYIGHDVCVDDFSTLYPLVSVSGNTHLFEGVQMGTNSTIIQGLEIGCNSFIGAGATVVSDIPANVVAVGTPCRPIKEK